MSDHVLSRRPTKQPPQPIHVIGMHKGEELVIRRGHEAGRGTKGDLRPGHYRSARDSTSINPLKREPIDPAMPEIPPS